MTGDRWQERLGALEVQELGEGLRLRHAREFAQRRRGLAGLDDLGPDVGLVIHSCRSVHTVGMRFALDLLWLDGEGRLVRVDRDVAPRRVRTCRAARSVVEVLAGGADRFVARMPPVDSHPS